MRRLASTPEGHSGPLHCHLSPPGVQPPSSRHAPTRRSYPRAPARKDTVYTRHSLRQGSATSARLYFRLEGGLKQPIPARSGLTSPAPEPRRVSSGRGNSLAPQRAEAEAPPFPGPSGRALHASRALQASPTSPGSRRRGAVRGGALLYLAPLGPAPHTTASLPS